jgi:hypothetical protein
MRQSNIFVLFAGLITFTFTGCESHQAKVDALQKEYDRLGAQFQKDCSAEYFEVPPTLSQKCADEKRQTEDAGKRLQAERAKQ